VFGYFLDKIIEKIQVLST